jgi:hypothetical protein
MKKRKNLFCSLLVAATVGQSCIVIEIPANGDFTSEYENTFKSKTVKGDRNVVNKEITVSDYAEIICSVPGEIVYLQEPDKTPYLQITTDENILPFLEIETTKNCVQIKCRKNANIRPSQLTIHTHSSHLNKVEVSGSGTVHLKKDVQSGDMGIRISGSGRVVSDNLSCENTHLSVTGSGRIELKGAGDKATYAVTGSGNIDAFAYRVRDVNCRVTGSGNVLAYAEDKLTAEITGSGIVKYMGNPPTTNTRVTGSGNIKQIK